MQKLRSVLLSLLALTLLAAPLGASAAAPDDGGEAWTCQWNACPPQ